MSANSQNRRRRPAARQDHVQVRVPGLEEIDHLGRIEVAELHDDVDLVEDDEVILLEAMASLLTSQICRVVAMSCSRFWVIQVKPSPIGRISMSQSQVVGVGAEQVGQLFLAGLPLALDVLHHEHVEAVAQGAEGQAQAMVVLPLPSPVMTMTRPWRRLPVMDSPPWAPRLRYTAARQRSGKDRPSTSSTGRQSCRGHVPVAPRGGNAANPSPCPRPGFTPRLASVFAWARVSSQGLRRASGDVGTPIGEQYTQTGCRGCRRRVATHSRLAASRPWANGVVPPTGSRSRACRALCMPRDGGTPVPPRCPGRPAAPPGCGAGKACSSSASTAASV